MKKIKTTFSWLKKYRKTIAIILFISYMILSLFFIISYWNSIKDQIDLSATKIQPQFLIYSFVFQTIGFFLSTHIWQDVLRAYNLITDYWRNFRNYSYSLLSTILPGKVLFHLGRMALYHNDGIDGRIVGVAGISEAILIGNGSLVLYTACYFVYPDANLLINPWISVILAGATILTLTPPIFKKLVLWTNRSILRNKEIILVEYSLLKGISWVVGEIIVVFLGGISLYLFLFTFVNIDNNQTLLIVAVWAAASASASFLFWLPGSFLVRDGAMLLVLQKILPNVQLAFSIIILHRIWIIISITLFALIIWFIFDLSKNLKKNIN